MFYIIFILYGILILTFVVLSVFIVYHLAKYSLNATLNKIMLPIFVIISSLLLFSNILLFSSISWEELIYRIF